MKRIITTSLFALLSLAIYSQPPQSFKYQAVVRDASGQLISNQSIDFRISIRNGSAGGTIVYQETFLETTNQFGMANLDIGLGTAVIGTFAAIDWSTGSKFMQVDYKVGANYIQLGTTELSSVPYALFSQRSSDWDRNGDNLFASNPGFVGIGTQTNYGKLTVYNSNDIGIFSESQYNHAIYGVSSAGFGSAILGKGKTSTCAGILGMNIYGGKGVVGISEGGFAGYFDGDLYASDRVGIGTESPDVPLVIKTSGAGDAIKIISNTDNTLAKFRHTGNNSGSLYLYNGSENNTVFLWGEGTSFINGGPLGLGTSTVSNAKLQIEGTGTYDAIVKINNTGTNGASFFFGSTNSAWGGGANQNLFIMGSGAPTSANIDLAINSSGYVGIATTEPTQTLDVNGGGRYRSLTTGTVYSGVYMTSNGTLISGSSDERLKQNIIPLKGSLDKVKKLQGVSFEWRENPEVKSIGFIAQEFEKVVPELAFTNPTDGYKGINYAEVTALLVEAIKEQQEIIEKQQFQIDELRNIISQINH